MTYALQESLVIPASPMEVYAVISDVTRTGEWSQQCYRCRWDSDARGVGARFTGDNRTPEREWSTTSEVIADVPGEHFAWSVGPGRAEWGFRLREVPGGTELTEYTRTTEYLEAVFAERYGDRAEEEIAVRQAAAREGIPATLAALREVLAAR
ncbi:SRPBCC family protein [Brachybacterium sp. YJGR34]|uniref:SRPBCC family protein n=1 Tax=Brachybacterium sp. YJGR34 TaxID=2059911 RepID=UPI000E0AA2E0|nr:SRPBCC family protein [Brachybacterium sp. YJGR34]